MKINIFTTILSAVLAAIIAYFLSFYVLGENRLILGIGSFLTLLITLIGTVSLSFNYEKTTALSRIISSIFFALILATQVFFTVVDRFVLPTYILVTGGALILYALITYGISRSKH